MSFKNLLWRLLTNISSHFRLICATGELLDHVIIGGSAIFVLSNVLIKKIKQSSINCAYHSAF